MYALLRVCFCYVKYMFDDPLSGCPISFSTQICSCSVKYSNVHHFLWEWLILSHLLWSYRIWKKNWELAYINWLLVGIKHYIYPGEGTVMFSASPNSFLLNKICLNQYTKITEVDLFAFIHKLFHEDFSIVVAINPVANSPFVFLIYSNLVGCLNRYSWWFTILVANLYW